MRANINVAVIAHVVDCQNRDVVVTCAAGSLGLPLGLRLGGRTTASATTKCRAFKRLHPSSHAIASGGCGSYLPKSVVRVMREQWRSERFTALLGCAA